MDEIPQKCLDCKFTVHDGVILPVILNKRVTREKMYKVCYELNKDICDANKKGENDE